MYIYTLISNNRAYLGAEQVVGCPSPTFDERATYFYEFYNVFEFVEVFI